MPSGNVSAVQVHGAWADGSSWSKVIDGLKKQGVDAVTHVVAEAVQAISAR